MVVAVCTISRQEQKVFTVARPNAVRICPIEETVPFHRNFFLAERVADVTARRAVLGAFGRTDGS